MKLTDTQKKWAWIVSAVLVLIHFAPAFLSNIRRTFAGSPPPAVLSKPSAVRPLPVQVVPAPLTPEQIANAPLARVPGIWIGESVRPDKATSCALRLEVRPNPFLPDSYTGYSTMSCGPALALMGGRLNGSSQARSIMSQMMPVSTILAGNAVNGSIEFKTRQTIGTPSDGCQIAGVTLTPFGESNLALKWQEAPDPCRGGDMVMRRSVR